METINESVIIQITLQCERCQNTSIEICSGYEVERLKKELKFLKCDFCKNSTVSIANGRA